MLVLEGVWNTEEKQHVATVCDTVCDGVQEAAVVTS